MGRGWIRSWDFISSVAISHWGEGYEKPGVLKE